MHYCAETSAASCVRRKRVADLHMSHTDLPSPVSTTDRRKTYQAQHLGIREVELRGYLPLGDRIYSLATVLAGVLRPYEDGGLRFQVQQSVDGFELVAS